MTCNACGLDLDDPTDGGHPSLADCVAALRIALADARAQLIAQRGGFAPVPTREFVERARLNEQMREKTDDMLRDETPERFVVGTVTREPSMFTDEEAASLQRGLDRLRDGLVRKHGPVVGQMIDDFGGNTGGPIMDESHEMTEEDWQKADELAERRRLPRSPVRGHVEGTALFEVTLSPEARARMESHLVDYTGPNTMELLADPGLLPEGATLDHVAGHPVFVTEAGMARQVGTIVGVEQVNGKPMLRLRVTEGDVLSVLAMGGVDALRCAVTDEDWRQLTRPRGSSVVVINPETDDGEAPPDRPAVVWLLGSMRLTGSTEIWHGDAQATWRLTLERATTAGAPDIREAAVWFVDARGGRHRVGVVETFTVMRAGAGTVIGEIGLSVDLPEAWPLANRLGQLLSVTVEGDASCRATDLVLRPEG